MKKFSVPCTFGNVQAPFTVYVGSPEPQHHPLHFQAEWLTKTRGGTVNKDIMDSISKLYELSKKNNIDFEELCVFAFNNEETTDSGLGEAPAPL